MQDAFVQSPALAGVPADFDFIFGRWNVHHRRLRHRLQACEEWISFEGRSEFRPLMGGQGNVDDNWLDLPGEPYRAATLRAYDPKTQQWAIWWLDGRYPDRIDTPMRGSFDSQDGIGLFLADDTFEGRPIRVRFIWTARGPNQGPRWEQAFSEDGGASWETNWVMNFERAD